MVPNGVLYSLSRNYLLRERKLQNAILIKWVVYRKSAQNQKFWYRGDQKNWFLQYFSKQTNFKDIQVLCFKLLPRVWKFSGEPKIQNALFPKWVIFTKCAKNEISWDRQDLKISFLVYYPKPNHLKDMQVET